MSGFYKQIRLKGQAEEDIYFAKRDKELIEALRRKKLKKHLQGKSDLKNKKTCKRQVKAFEKEFAEISRKHQSIFRKIYKDYKKLLKKIEKKCQHN